MKNGSAPEPVCRRNPGLLYGLGNLIENATDFAKSEVRVIARWNKAILEITIEDDGPGFRQTSSAASANPMSRHAPIGILKHEANSGLGLGLFIAKTLARTFRRHGRHQQQAAAAIGRPHHHALAGRA